MGYQLVKKLNSLLVHLSAFHTLGLAIWDLRNHEVFRIILDPGRQKRITLSLEFINTVAVQARGSDVKIPEWGQPFSTRGMPCLASIFATFGRTEDQPNDNPGALVRCMADSISNLTDREI
jgi:hypothetical protein